MTLNLWLALGAFAAFWVVAIYAYLRITRNVRNANLAALHASAISVFTSATTGPGAFACPHMSISGVVSASCGACGPLQRAA